MYKYLLPAIMLLPVITTAQEDGTPKGKKIKCSVIDAATRKPVKNVNALVQGSEEKIVAPNGLFQAVLAPGQQVEITAPGYEDRQIMVTPDGKCIAELTADEGGADSDKEEKEDKEEE